MRDETEIIHRSRSEESPKPQCPEFEPDLYLEMIDFRI